MAHRTEKTDDSRVQPQCAIKVVGVGGGGCNAVNSMIRLGIQDVEFFVLNTDAQHLKTSECLNKLQIGAELTNGLGCGGDPEMGRQAAEAARDEITDMLCEASMVFVTAGLGGGAGTGAAPVVASIARELGILTVAIVTRPFKFEGPLRMRRAEEGLVQLREASDSIIVVSNDRLLEVAGPQASLLDSFELANQVLGQGVWSISEMISRPALIKVDFADVRTLMQNSGGAILGIGQGTGDSRAAEAVEQACSSPLLDRTEVTGANKVLISFAGPENITLQEVNDAASQVQKMANANVDLVFGVRIDDTLDNTVKVTILATGFDEPGQDSKRQSAAAPEAKPAIKPARPESRATAEDDPAAGKNGVATPAPVKILAAPAPSQSAASSRKVEDEDVIQLPEEEDEIPQPAPRTTNGKNGKSDKAATGGARVLPVAKATQADEESDEDFQLTDDLKEVLARWDDEEEGDDLYSPFPGQKEDAIQDEVAPTRAGEVIPEPSKPAAPAATGAPAAKGTNGKAVRENAAVKSETTADIFDVIDEAKEKRHEPAAAGNVLSERKPRLDATRPDPKPDEEDLEIPAFLRRRRSGFRIF